MSALSLEADAPSKPPSLARHRPSPLPAALPIPLSQLMGTSWSVAASTQNTLAYMPLIASDEHIAHAAGTSYILYYVLT